jgi:hypothetical protein
MYHVFPCSEIFCAYVNTSSDSQISQNNKHAYYGVLSQQSEYSHQNKAEADYN